MSGCDPGCPPAQPGPRGARGPAGPQGPVGPQGPAGPAGEALTIQEEGVLVGTTSILNFIGAGVTATLDAPNNRINVTIPGGGGDSCWICDDPAGVTQLATTTDQVVLGASAPVGTEKLRVVGHQLFDNLNELRWQSSPAGTIVGAMTVDAAEQLLIGIPGSLPTGQVHDVAATGFYSWTQNGASVPTTGIWRWMHGLTFVGRNSLGTLNVQLGDWGATGVNVLQWGTDDLTFFRLRVNNFLQMIVGSSTRLTVEPSNLHIHDGINANYFIQGNNEAMLGFNIAAAGVRNLAFFNSGAAAMNGMDGGIYFLNAVAAPTADPVGGGYLYVVAGGGTWRGSGGTITTFGPA